MTPDVSRILRVPGRLSHTPVSLATAYPHGGTALGTVARARARPVDPAFVETAQEYGGAPVDLIEGGPRWVLDFELRDVQDAAALSAVFPCYVAGRSGGPVLKFNAGGSVRAGFRVGTLLSFVLVFTPENEDAHPWLILRRAVPAVQETAALALAGNLSPVLPVRFYATLNSAKDVFDWGRRRDLTL
jgi:hypothetical protein